MLNATEDAKDDIEIFLKIIAQNLNFYVKNMESFINKEFIIKVYFYFEI